MKKRSKHAEVVLDIDQMRMIRLLYSLNYKYTIAATIEIYVQDSKKTDGSESQVHCADPEFSYKAQEIQPDDEVGDLFKWKVTITVPRTASGPEYGARTVQVKDKESSNIEAAFEGKDIATLRDLVRSSCVHASFPTICLRTLSTYAGPAQTPVELAQAAVKVSLSRANKASNYLFTLHTSSKCEAGGLSDCLSQISDTVDKLRRTLSELKHLRSGTFRPPADISESSAAYQSIDRSLTPMPSLAIFLKTKNKASPAHPSTTIIALKLKSIGSLPA
ncbi:hypothetical protein RJ640_011015 [Escallonia rubra]|uniref:Pectinesterase inhibitor domain-containing protein n=1 Tax=Escallonia rubra TaxID=112253 RepID=A0AA88UJ08_9ASTE|nr:hypothetical protein RJ640_011015 [Escallonia rubra]